MDTPIKLLVDFVSSSQEDIANNTVQTGDALGIVCLLLFLTLSVAGIFVFKKYKLMAMSKCGSSQSIFANNKSIVSKRSFKVIAALLTMFVSLLIGFCFSQYAYGNNESHLVSDTNKIIATVSDDGNISFSSCNLKNISDLKYTLSKCSVSVTQEAKSVDAINSSKLTISGFDGTIYNDVPDGAPHGVENIKVLAQDESTKLGFSIANLSKENALALCGKPVFEINLQPVEENKLSLNPAFANVMSIDDVVNASINTESDGEISVESTDYLSAEITGTGQKTLAVTALKQSITPQTITIKQDATDKYAAASATFTVNKIDRKNLTISLDPESVDSLVIDQSQEISVNTDSTGKISVTNTDYLTGSVEEKAVSVRALKASQTEQKITISQEATDKYTAASATFTVSKIEKKDVTISLDPSCIPELELRNSTILRLISDSSGAISFTNTEYLEGHRDETTIKFAFVEGIKVSDTPQSITLTQDETETYKAASVDFTVEKIIKKRSTGYLLPESINNLCINETTKVWFYSMSKGKISVESTEYLDASVAPDETIINVKALKLSEEPQTIKVKQEETEDYQPITVTFTVKKIEKNIPEIKINPNYTEYLLKGRSQEVSVETDSDGSVSVNKTEYLDASINQSDKQTTLDVIALKETEQKQILTINIAESSTYKATSITFSTGKIYNVERHSFQENGCNYAPVFNGKAIDNGFWFSYYDAKDDKYVYLDDSVTMTDLSNYIGNLYVSIIDLSKTPSKSCKCVAIRCVSQNFDDATGLPKTSGGTALEYVGRLQKDGEHWAGLNWHPESETALPVPNINSQDIDSSVSLDTVYNAYQDKVFGTNNRFWSSIATNGTNAYVWDCSQNNQHKWNSNCQRNSSCGIVFAKAFGRVKRVALQADGYKYCPVFLGSGNENGYKFFAGEFETVEVSSKSMKFLTQHIGHLWVEIEPGKGTANSGKCLAVRSSGPETYDEATKNSKWDTETSYPRRALNYGGKKKLPEEHWCSLDWTPDRAGTTHPFPEVIYGSGKDAIHSDISITDVCLSYSTYFIMIGYVWTCVASSDTTCFQWDLQDNYYMEFYRSNFEYCTSVFSRVF